MATYDVSKLAAVATAETAETKTIRIKVSGEDLTFLRTFASVTKCRRMGDAVTALIAACRKQSAA